VPTEALRAKVGRQGILNELRVAGQPSPVESLERSSPRKRRSSSWQREAGSW